MSSHAFIAETDEDHRIVSVWYAGTKARPRPARCEDVTSEKLRAAEFHGAAEDPIKAFLKKLRNQSA